ncbi:Thiol-disulfide isomerase or thioredoxin [Chitinophaga jiangningensis]|uniref:Thiol-disulfide isomerase or thioredoxin n=1 Tax=Chitinophaga jiangningensis TaxID=1419482 RepID=A0A1M7JZ80_9BACT|nr:TlpA disulfide reductase family protein [Chitinophaga jiangningensis]SHM58274.1 Thiol-disulfide isomerase or thioredoxin [Chitinophaga jiangningensis]
MKIIAITAAYLACMQYAYAQSNHTLSISDTPAAGHGITITADPRGTALAGSTPLYVIIDAEGKSKQLAADTLLLSATGQAKYTVPADAVVLTGRLYDGHITDDNNGKAYIFPVYREKKVLPYAWYRMSQLAQGMGGWKKDQQLALAYLKTEIAIYPAAEAEFRQQYYNMLINSPEPADKALLIQKLLTYHTTNEMELTLHQQYLAFLGQQQAADSVAHLLEKQFPEGKYVQRKQMAAVTQAPDFAAQQQLFKAFIQRFPEPAGGDYEYTGLYKAMAQSAVAAGNNQAAGYYISLLHRQEDQVATYVQLAQQQPEQSLSWLSQGIAVTDTTRVHTNWNAYMNAIPLYLSRQDVTTAHALAGTLYRHAGSREAALLLAQTSSASGQDATALRVLETTVKAGHSSPQIKKMLQALYERQYPGKDFTAWWNALQPATADHSGDIRAGMITETIAGIRLKDISGKEVDIAALKGKIVVLDFWATWCKPCIQSFPAMQEVMQQHPEVVFLFIATFETGEALGKVKQFAAEKKFPFRYLMDEKLSNGPGYKAFNQYKVASVPYKVILDKTGKVRFRTNGFDGNEEALVRELNTMIQLIQ